MWPWEHLAFGYVWYSLYSHLGRGEAPTSGPVVALAAATQLPDLIDKPLSWSVGLFPTGSALAHSLLFAAPLCAAAAAVGERIDRPRYGAAVAVGYASHLAGDVVSPLRSGGELAVYRLLWPFVTLPGYETELGFVERTVLYLHRAVAGVATSDLAAALVAYTAVHLSVVALWLYDGAPVLRWLLERTATDRRR